MVKRTDGSGGYGMLIGTAASEKEIEKFIARIKKYPDKDWCWKQLSKNPNITMEFIEKYPNKPWDWNWISSNPNVTMEFIDKYPEVYGTFGIHPHDAENELLTKNEIKLSKNILIPFPPDEVLIFNNSENIKRKMKNIIYKSFK